MDDFMDIKEFAEKHSLTLWATIREINKTLYQFMDEHGINVIINPDSKEFYLKWSIPHSIFAIECPSCSPCTNEEHFMKIYSKFRTCVLSMKEGDC